MISTNLASAKAAWDTIETIFQENKRTRTVALKGELRVIQMGDDTPDAYFSKIDSIITLLTDLGSTMDDDDIVTYAINGLSEKYGSLAQIIAHKDPFPDLAIVRTMVTTEEMRLWSKQPILSTSTTSSSPQVPTIVIAMPVMRTRPRSAATLAEVIAAGLTGLQTILQEVCFFMHDPREPHLSALKRILRYVRGTLSYGLQLYSSTMLSLVAYSDADWVGCPTTRRSTWVIVFFLAKNLLSWLIEAPILLSLDLVLRLEYRGVLPMRFAETCGLRYLLRELHTLSLCTLVYCEM
ncbi:hybrid signal transduction histidine kinase M [Tanacetum coccineum]